MLLKCSKNVRTLQRWLYEYKKGDLHRKQIYYSYKIEENIL